MCLVRWHLYMASLQRGIQMVDETDNEQSVSGAKPAGMRVVDVPESVRSLTWHLRLEVDDDPTGEVRLYIIFTSMGRVDYGLSPVLEFNHPLRHLRLLAKVPRAGFESDEVIGAWLNAVNLSLLRNASPIICSNLALHAKDAAQVHLAGAGLPPLDLEQIADEHLTEVRAYVRQLLGLKGARGALPLNERTLQGLLLEVFINIDPARFKKLSIGAALRYAHRT